MRECLLKLYGGDVRKPTTTVIIHGNKIKVGGQAVLKLDGAEGTKWLKGDEPTKVKMALMAAENFTAWHGAMSYQDEPCAAVWQLVRGGFDRGKWRLSRR